LSLIVRSLYS